MTTRRMLTRPEVLERVRLSNPTIHRLRRKGAFPAPFLLGEQKVAWWEDEIEEWLATRQRRAAAVAAAA